MGYRADLSLIRRIEKGIKEHGEEYQDAKIFFQRLEEVIFQRMQERKEKGLQETSELGDAEKVIRDNGITFYFSDEHSIIGRFGEIYREVGREEWEIVDDGVKVTESTFEEPENNAFLQGLAKRREEIEYLDREIEKLEIELSKKNNW